MKVLIVFGTRPELIKLIPIIKELNNKNIDFDLCSTSQHKEILDEIIKNEKLIVKYKLIRKEVNLNSMTSAMINDIGDILSDNNYTCCIVQGDTASAYAGAVASFLSKKSVYYVESGLRTFDLESPFPEEGFRKMISHIATHNFAVNDESKMNLENESLKNISVVGNTIIDFIIDDKSEISDSNKCLITIHRRENLGLIDNIFEEFKKFITSHKELNFIFTMHPNPLIRDKAKEYFKNISNIELADSLYVRDFYKLLKQCTFVITDSGGVQEECVFLNKKICVIRSHTERMTRGINLVDPKEKAIYEKIQHIYSSNIKFTYNGEFGDGTAAIKIVKKVGELECKKLQ